MAAHQDGTVAASELWSGGSSKLHNLSRLACRSRWHSSSVFTCCSCTVVRGVCRDAHTSVRSGVVFGSRVRLVAMLAKQSRSVPVLRCLDTVTVLGTSPRVDSSGRESCSSGAPEQVGHLPMGCLHADVVERVGGRNADEGGDRCRYRHAVRSCLTRSARSCSLRSCSFFLRAMFEVTRSRLGRGSNAT